MTIFIIGSQLEELKHNLMEEVDYALLSEPAWTLLFNWYGLSAESRPIARYTIIITILNYYYIIRYVIEYSAYAKNLRVEVYLVELKLCVHPYINDIKRQFFSRADTISKNNKLAYLQ